MRRNAGFFASFLWCVLLCQCATEHETKEFQPFFRTDPGGYYSTSYVYERQELEAKPDLSEYDRRRLVDLYEVELRQLTRDTPRFIALTAALQAFEDKGRAEKIEKLKSRVANSENRDADNDPSAIFVNPDFKRDYQQAYRLWNRDENEEALELAVALVRDPRFKDELSKAENFKGLNLQYRVALDLQNLGLAEEAYAAMRELDDCAPETAEAGFLLALTHLGAGDPPRAKSIFDEQCDPDETPSNLVKRLYWKTRLREAVGQKSVEDYESIIRSGVPGFYYFLAHARLGRPITAEVLDACTYRKKPIMVSGSVDGLLKDAEISLQYRLRSDASVYLQAASQKLKKGAGMDDIPALLYTAHLLLASGLQLEAMRIYSVVADLGQGQQPTVPFDYITEMFPTPHLSWIDAISKQWNVDPDFIYAIMRQESAFNPGALSPVGARGLMQLMPLLGGMISKQWRYDSYFNPKRSLFFARENLKLSTYHLHQLQTQLPHPALMAAAYNAGSRRAMNWWKRGPGAPLDVFVELIPVVETRNYVKLVLRNFVFYKLLRGRGKVDPLLVDLKMPEWSGAIEGLD